MRLGNGDNTALVRNSSGHRIQVFGGSGADEIEIRNVHVITDVDAIGGAGDDTIKMQAVTAGFDVNAQGGAGTMDSLEDDGSAISIGGFEIFLVP